MFRPVSGGCGGAAGGAELALGGENYYLVSLIVLTGNGRLFLSFEREKPPTQELVLLAVPVRGDGGGADGLCRRALLQAGDGADYPGRCSLWLPGGVPVRGHEPVCQQLLLWPRGVDAMADVCLRPGGGLLAGVIFRRLGRMPRKRIPMALFGAVCAVSVGPLLDTSTLFLMAAQVLPASAAAVYLAGLPVNGIHAGATAFFLLWPVR